MKEQGSPVPETELILSTAGMIDVSTFYFGLLPLGNLAQLASDAGYDGMEYFPLGPWAMWQARLRSITPETLKKIHSGRISFNDTSPRDALMHSKPHLAILAMLALPYRPNSYRHLVNIQEMTGRDMPVIVTPCHEEKGEQEPPLFPLLHHKLVQPTPDVMTRFGVSTMDAFITQTQLRGYAGLCYTTGYSADFFHHYQELVDFLSTHEKDVHMIQFDAGRTDVPGRESSALDQLRDLYNGQTHPHHTDIFASLEAIREAKLAQPVVVAIRANAIAQMLGKRLLGPQEYIAAHQKISANIKQALGIT